jgi:hypothetical protein
LGFYFSLLNFHGNFFQEKIVKVLFLSLER